MQSRELKQNNIQSIIKEQIIQKIIASKYCINEILFNANKNNESNEQEADKLQTSDYIKLISHQKKCVIGKKWKRLQYLHQMGYVFQQDYKSFLMIISQAHYLKLDNPHYYQGILNKKQEYPKLFFSSIQKDIPRTLVNGHPFQENLRNVLYAYAIRNPTLVYCQGMNYIVAYLLMNGFSQEQGFWFLVRLIEFILPYDYFKDLGTISITSLLFNDLIQELYPQFAQQIHSVGMDTSMFLITWFICLFTKGFINSVSHYLLGSILLYSHRFEVGYVLVYLSLSIIDVIKHKQVPISFQKDFKSFKDNLETSVYQISLNQLKQSIKRIHLDYNSFMVLYKAYQSIRSERVEINKERQLNQGKFILPVCSLEYPICLHRIQICKKIGQVEQAHILKSIYYLEQYYIEDYFINHIQEQPIIFPDQNQNQSLMYRKPHICLNQNKKKVLKQRISLKDQSDKIIQSENKQKNNIENQCQISIQVHSHISNIEERYTQLSEYFVVDPDYLTKQQISQKQITQQSTKSNKVNNIVAVVFEKFINSLKIFRK